MEGGRGKEHLLVLKVMRLTKPSMMLVQPITCDARDLPGTTFATHQQRDLACPRGLSQFALGELLTLPQNFGNIFLGETFSSYISVHNDSKQACMDIMLKADLQTSSQRHPLSSSELVSELRPEGSIDDIIHHEVKELGMHILVCAVSYSTQNGEKMYFKKFFRFHVLKPLDVKTKFYNAESDEVYLEAQIQNIMPTAIYVDRVNLDPSPQYRVIELNRQRGAEGVETGVFGAVDCMNPLDVRQYLYCLRPQPATDARLLKGVTNIGKLDIVWKTNMGEKGRLQTCVLQRVAPGYGDIRLTISQLPHSELIEKVFDVQMLVTNCCERTMDLSLVLQNGQQAGLLWCGISGRSLGKLPPNESIDLHLSMIAIQPGLQVIGGLRLTDTFLKRTYEHDDIAQIFISNDCDAV